MWYEASGTIIRDACALQNVAILLPEEIKEKKEWLKLSWNDLLENALSEQPAN